jgi:hypothetical protein
MHLLLRRINILERLSTAKQVCNALIPRWRTARSAQVAATNSSDGLIVGSF